MHAILLNFAIIAVAPLILTPREFTTAGSLHLSFSTEALVVNIFSVKRFARMWDVESWLSSLTRPGNPVRLSTLFDRFVRPGGSCFGQSTIAKICLVHRAYLVDDEGSATIRLPFTAAGQYIVESFELMAIPRVAINPKERPIVPSQDLLSAESHSFTVLFADEASAAWAKTVGVFFHKWSLTDLVDEAFANAGLGQVIEIGTGRSTVPISHIAASFGEVVVAFDDFRVLPQPLLEMNVDLRIGPIKETIDTLDTSRPISVLHVNVSNFTRDLSFILSKVACLLRRDSIVILSDVFNLHAGDVSNLTMLKMSSRQIGLTAEYLPCFFETTVVIRITMGADSRICAEAVAEMEGNAERSRAAEEGHAMRSLKALATSMSTQLRSKTKNDALGELLSKVVN